jgi:hypothetical protein
VRVLSLGAGVQSSTLLLMACEGKLAINAAIFADTQWEPRAVYDHLAWLEQQAAAAGIPVHRVTTGNLRAAALSGSTRFASIPLHLRNADGTPAMLRRQCTKEYKVAPIRRYLRAGGVTARLPATLLLGISLDEVHRMRTSSVQYLIHEYPLIDQRMTRADCLRWLEQRGYPRPQKSACIGCPFHDNGHWRRLRDESPDEWADAIAFDAAIRNGRTRIRAEAFLHRQLVPLNQADIRSEQERGQMDLFGEECAGVCGV